MDQLSTVCPCLKKRERRSGGMAREKGKGRGRRRKEGREKGEKERKAL